jgi:DNA polymerase-3 subunit delta
MDHQDILKKIHDKAYYPVYLLMGEEAYYIDLISDALENKVLDENAKEFNLTVLYGKDVDVPAIVNYAKRYPMMSNYQVVIVKEAQDIKKIEELQAYVEKPLKSTILVLCYKYGKVDKRKTFAKAVEKNGILYESPRIYDNQVPAWITQYLKKLNYTIQPKAAELLAESLGTNISRLVNEISKLIINVPAGKEITAAHIEQNIGISKDFNVFELSKALEQRDRTKVNRIILHFAKNEKEFAVPMVTAILYTTFTRLIKWHYTTDRSQDNLAAVLGVNKFLVPEYSKAAANFTRAKLFRIIGVLREYDMKSKGLDGGSANQGDLLKEMVWKIMN